MPTTAPGEINYVCSFMIDAMQFQRKQQAIHTQSLLFSVTIRDEIEMRLYIIYDRQMHVTNGKLNVCQNNKNTIMICFTRWLH